MLHNLKILPEYYENVVNRRKQFEVRVNDRDYKVNDVLRLCEYDGDIYTGNTVLVNVDYILNEYKDVIAKDYVIMSISLINMREGFDIDNTPYYKDLKEYLSVVLNKNAWDGTMENAIDIIDENRDIKIPCNNTLVPLLIHMQIDKLGEHKDENK